MKHLPLLILALLLPLTLSAKKAKKNTSAYCQPVFIYGMSTSFNDSIAYLTEVQYLDSAYLEKGKFLGGIKDYSGQLDQHFFKSGTERVSTIFFATTQKKAEKQYIKLRKKYLNPKSHMVLKPLTRQDFTFTTVRPAYDEDNIPEQKVAKKKKGKKDRPQGAPDGKRPPMGGGPGGGGMGGPGGGMGGPGGGMGGPGGGMGGM